MTSSPFFVVVLGMGTVFVGLVLLILLTYLMSYVLKRNKQAAPVPQAAISAQSATAQMGMPEFADRKRFDAAVAAAIATYMGTDVTGLRIRSIRRISGADGDRGGFVAAVSAAIASTMEADVQGLRIHSIRKL